MATHTLSERPVGLIGQPRRRTEDPPLLSGAGRYVADLRLPGLLTFALLRSPYGHARIASVDVEAARSMPGVVDVLVGQETAHLTHLTINPAVPDVLKPLHLPLAVDRVRFVGDEVAAVLAESPAAARDAVEAIEVDYEPLPAVADARAALEPDAPLVHEQFGTNQAYARGFGTPPEEIEAALAAADHVVAFEMKQARVAPMAIEPRGVVASYDPAEERLTVWSSTQRPFLVRAELAAALGLPAERIHVIAPDVGGAFGSKGPVYREEILAAYLAIKHGRPVRWIATRSEEFASTMQGRDQAISVRAAFSREGDLQAIHVRQVPNLGAYLHGSTALPPTRTARLICGAYHVPLARGEIVAAFTNTASTGPYRGAGRPEAAFLIERTMDLAARDLGLDPVAIRRRNFIQPEDFPWTTPTGLTYDSGDYERTLDTALKAVDYAGLRAEQERVRASGGLFGIGLSTFVEPSGGGWESAIVRVKKDGHVEAFTGASAHGQGHRTTFAQIIAERLQVPAEHVTVTGGDTAVVPDGVGTFGSRSVVLGGSAAVQAADEVLVRMRQVAADLFEVAAEDVIYHDGRFQPAGVAGREIAFAEVAAAAYEESRLPEDGEIPLQASVQFKEAREGYSHGTHIAAVSIDPETGRVTLRHFAAVDDAGVLINPLLAEGQVQGGLAQGIGQALQEQVVYGDDGTLMTASLGDYSVPRARDVPHYVLGETQTPSPLNPLGAKGVGEGGAVGAPPAVANAVIDALAPLGIRHLDLPLTAECIWQAIQDARR